MLQNDQEKKIFSVNKNPQSSEKEIKEQQQQHIHLIFDKNDIIRVDFPKTQHVIVPYP